MGGDGQTKETTAASYHDTTIADGGGSSIFIQQHGIRHGRTPSEFSGSAFWFQPSSGAGY
jgi:hypothetical protein